MIEVPLLYGKRVVAWVKADADDEDLIMQYAPWRIDWQRGSKKKPNRHPHPYARRDFRVEGRKFTLYMHRLLVVGWERGGFVDHINGDTFDNRKSNLRLVDASTNSKNRRTRVDCTCEKAALYVSL